MHNPIKKLLFIEFIYYFRSFTKNNNFFINLVKNVELKKLFINIINEYIILEIDEKYMDNYLYLIQNFLNHYDLADIDKNDTHKKVYFEIIDCFLIII